MYRAGSICYRPTRCEDGNLMRFDPQDDDPYLETKIRKCPESDGHGCMPCDGCGENIPVGDRANATLVPPDYMPESFRKRATVTLCASCRDVDGES